MLAANVALAVAMARLVRTLIMRGAKLSDDEIWILTILQCNVESAPDSGLSPIEILNIVKRTRSDANTEWVSCQLSRLREVPVRDGSTVKLASEDALGHWRPHV
jgi:hypothetical protein